jgi:hypothetical protein
LAVSLNELKRLRVRFMNMADRETGLLRKEVVCEQPEIALNPFVHRLIDIILDPRRASRLGQTLASVMWVDRSMSHYLQTMQFTSMSKPPQV